MRTLRAPFALTIMLAILLVLTGGVLRAQDEDSGGLKSLPDRPLPAGTRLYADINPLNPVIGDRIHYAIVVEGNLKIEQYNAPSFQVGGGLELLSGPSEQSRFSMMNGRSTQETSLIYTLRAIDTGEYTIPPARLRINGVWYDTNPVTVAIGDLPQAEGDLSGIISAETGDSRINQQLRNRYFARIELPKEAYHGQAIPVPVYIYRDPTLPEFLRWRLARNISGSDFIIPDVLNQQNVSRTIDWEDVEFAGHPFKRVNLFTVFAVPTKTGLLRLTPPQINVSLPVDPRYNRNNDLFGMMMGSPANQIGAELQMRMQEINVLPAPDKPAEALQQIVGNAKIQITADRDELPQRELLSLTLSIAGRGFFGLMSKPELPDLPNFTLVDTQTESRMDTLANRLFSEKTFEYVLQAMSPGEVEIPPLTFSIFDPDTGEQKLLSTDPISVKIKPAQANSVQISSPGAAPGALAGPPQNHAEARVLGSDVAYIDTRPLTAASISTQSQFYLRPWFWALQLLPALAAIGYGLVAYNARRGKTESDSARTRKGRRAAASALREARNQAATAKRDEFYATLSGGIMQFVASLLGRSVQGLANEEAVIALRERGYDAQSCTQLDELLRRGDAMRYSPAPDDESNRLKILDSAEELLAGLSRQKGAKP